MGSRRSHLDRVHIPALGRLHHAGRLALNLLGTIAGDQGSSHGVSDVYLWLFLIFRGLGFSTVGVIGAKRHAKRHYTDGPMGGARG